MTTTSRKLTTIRASAGDLAEIDKRARRAKLSRTDYLIRKALDQPVGEENFEDRVDDLERRLKRLEEVQFGSIA